MVEEDLLELKHNPEHKIQILSITNWEAENYSVPPFSGTIFVGNFAMILVGELNHPNYITTIV